jgi:hypothetical protein
LFSGGFNGGRLMVKSFRFFFLLFTSSRITSLHGTTATRYYDRDSCEGHDGYDSLGSWL